MTFVLFNSAWYSFLSFSLCYFSLFASSLVDLRLGFFSSLAFFLVCSYFICYTSAWYSVTIVVFLSYASVRVFSILSSSATLLTSS